MDYVLATSIAVQVSAIAASIGARDTVAMPVDDRFSRPDGVSGWKIRPSRSAFAR